MRLGVLLPHRGVVIQSARRPPLEECWTVARMADAAGMDVWVGDSVVAKPRMGPVPNWNRNAAAIKDATCVSTMVMNTRSKPAATACRGPFLASSSSRIRSKISTFESTPMPIVSRKPAIPGNVITAPR